MQEQLCRYCQRAFQPSKHRPQQTVCSDSACQRHRRNDYHRHKITNDAVYRQVCLDSPQKWRRLNSGYWKQYRQQHPEAVTRNRERQHARDQKRHWRRLANNNLVLDLKSFPAEIWLVGPAVAELANNNLVPGQVMIVEAVSHRLSLPPSACQQHPYGKSAAAAR
jgi:hypothetical protein